MDSKTTLRRNRPMCLTRNLVIPFTRFRMWTNHIMRGQILCTGLIVCRGFKVTNYMYRSIRPPSPYQRPLLSAALLQSPPSDDESPPSSEYDSQEPPRSNDDRSHPHYKAKPGPDGLYHCPHADRKE